MKIAIPTLIITIVASVYANAELPEQREYTYRERAGAKNTREVRIERAQVKQREANLINDEFATICEYVRLKVCAKYGSPEEALKHVDEIKSECRAQIFGFASKHNISDTLTWAYKMQEQVTISLQPKSSPEVAKL